MQAQLSSPHNTKTVYYSVILELDGFFTCDVHDTIFVSSTPTKIENVHITWNEIVPHMMIHPDGSARRDGKRIPRRRLFCDVEEETQPEPKLESAIKFDLEYLEVDDPDATVIFVAEDPDNYGLNSCRTDGEDGRLLEW